jgi:hypothetical protein
MKERARINKIKAIKRSDGMTCHNQKEIEEVAKEFYTNLFTAQNDVEPDLVTEWVQRYVTDNMNEFLSAPFTVEEIEKALFMMDPNKSQTMMVSLLDFFRNIGIFSRMILALRFLISCRVGI